MIPSVRWKVEDKGTFREPKFYVIRELRSGRGKIVAGPFNSRIEANAARDTLRRSYVP